MKKIFFIVLFFSLIVACSKTADQGSMLGEQEGGPMIIITAEWKAKEGHEQELGKYLQEMVKAVETQEPGCLQYTLHQGMEDKGRFYFYERYKNMDAVDAHKTTPHFQNLMNQTQDLVAEAVRVNLFELYSQN